MFALNMAVCGFWPNDAGCGGQWYTGVVVSLDYLNRKVHIQYDDGDVDNAVPWHKARISDG